MWLTTVSSPNAVDLSILHSFLYQNKSQFRYYQLLIFQKSQGTSSFLLSILQIPKSGPTGPSKHP